MSGWRWVEWLASEALIRETMQLDRPMPTGWRHFLDEHPIATYMTFMAVIVLVATIAVLATGGAT